MSLATDLNDRLNDVARDWGRSLEYQRYLDTPLTRERAQIVATQGGLFVRNRRVCWAYASAMAPLDVKQYIVEHEHEELIRDEYIEGGHYQLWVQQGEIIGLTSDEMDNARPLPTTRAALYSWIHMAQTLPWLDAFSASAILERTNDNTLFEGGGHAAQAGKRWREQLGLSWEEVPNFQVHRQADDAHNEGAASVLERHVKDESDLLRVEAAARECLETYQVYLVGVAMAMEAIPTSS